MTAHLYVPEHDAGFFPDPRYPSDLTERWPPCSSTSVPAYATSAALDSLQAALLGALEKMRSLGGFDLVTLHTQLIDSDRRVDAVESAVRAAQAAGDVWIARASDIAVWWLARSRLESRSTSCCRGAPPDAVTVVGDAGDGEGAADLVVAPSV